MGQLKMFLNSKYAKVELITQLLTFQSGTWFDVYNKTHWIFVIETALRKILFNFIVNNLESYLVRFTTTMIELFVKIQDWHWIFFRIKASSQMLNMVLNLSLVTTLNLDKRLQRRNQSSVKRLIRKVFISKIAND